MIGLYLLAISLAINLSKSKHYLVETEDSSVKLQSEGNFTFALREEEIFASLWLEYSLDTYYFREYWDGWDRCKECEYEDSNKSKGIFF